MMDKEQQIKEMKSDFVAIMCDCYGDETEISDSFVEGVHNIGYRKINEGAVVLTKEELTKHDEKVRKEAREEILDDIFGPWNEIGDGIYELTPKDKKMLYKKFGVEVEE